MLLSGQEYNHTNIKGASKSMKKENFFKNTKINKSVYITVVTLLVALAVIVVMVTATNRAKKRNELPPDTTDGSSVQTPDTTAEGNNSDGNKEPDKDVGGTVPTFVLPVSGKLVKAHDETKQVFSNTMEDYRVHLGIDISTEENAPVSAAADGIVSQIWEDELMGQCIAIKHDGDSYTIYKNLSATIPGKISEGASVKAGDLIGSVGTSAMIEIADEPHLHFEVTVGGLQVDPTDYFEDSALVSLNVDENYEG